MNYALNEAKIGDLFHITERDGKSIDAFFAGTYKRSGYEDSTIYNFLYWGAFSQRMHKAAYGTSKNYKWQTSDFFVYREKIIESLANIEESHFSLYNAPLIAYSNQDFFIEKPWLTLCGCQFETTDVNRHLTITKLKEVNTTQGLHQPVLPKRKEVIIHV